MTDSLAVDVKTNRKLLELLAVAGMSECGKEFLLISEGDQVKIEPRGVYGSPELYTETQIRDGKIDAQAPPGEMLTF